MSPEDLRMIEWPLEVTARTSPRGPLPDVRELGPVDGLVAWVDAGGDATVLERRDE